MKSDEAFNEQIITARLGQRVSPFAPLRTPAFQVLWFICICANMAAWMSEVAAAWLMTSIRPSPLWVALVQTASTLPLFLLGLPSGAFADLVDRRRYLIATQVLAAILSALLCGVVLLGSMTPVTLLLLTFGFGISIAMRWPVLGAMAADAVPAHHIAQAFALNGVAMNASRVIGPLLAGVLIASLGTAAVFVLNAALSVLTVAALVRWPGVVESPRSREALGAAMWTGILYVARSEQLRAVLARIASFIFSTSATLALLPLVAKERLGPGAGNYTILLAATGGGAIWAAMLMPRIRQFLDLEQRVVLGTALTSAAAVVLAYSTLLWCSAATMIVFGFAFLLVSNSLTVAAQLSLDSWVRARGISIYQMALMGSTAVGAACWGQLATWTSVPITIIISAASSLALVLCVHFVGSRPASD